MLKFCLVDDDPIFAMIVQSLAEKLCDHVKFVHYKNGEEALGHLSQTLREDLPDLVFLDINMPMMNGWEFLEEYSALGFARLPIYLISSSIDPEDRFKAKSNAQVIDLLEKPLTKIKLEQILQTVVEAESV